MSNGVGYDVKDAINEVGRSFKILRTPVIEGEKVLFESDYSPSLTNLVLKVYFYWDTEVVSGDLIQVSDGTFIVTAVEPNSLEDEVYLIWGELYRCNLTGTLKRQASGSSYYDTTSYRRSVTWETVVETAYCTLIEGAIGGSLEEIRPFFVSDGELILIFPKYYGIQQEDRLETSSGARYRIKYFDNRINTDAIIAFCERDVRTPDG